jgi:hypothetical protein
MPQSFTKYLLTIGCLTTLTLSNTSPVAADAVPPTANIGYQNNGYLGIGGTIGLNGNTTALGKGGLVILSKVRFSDSLSLHDATLVFGNAAPTSMIIVTADFPIRNDAGQTIVSPFIGGGAMFRFDGGLSISPAVSGGIDLPISRNFTGTLRINGGFISNRDADVGILAGVGYTFGR